VRRVASLLVNIVLEVEANVGVHDGLLRQVLELELDSEDRPDSLILNKVS